MREQHQGSNIRVIDVPGLGPEAIIADMSTETIVLLDPLMSCEDRMDCMAQALEEQEQRLAG
jgi:hypothetical protein